MMFEQGGQAVVLVPVPGLHAVPPQMQLQSGSTLTTAPAQALYLPYNLVIKQETNEPRFNGQVIFSENNHQVMLQQNPYLVPVTSGMTIKSEPETVLTGTGLLQSSIPVTVSGMLTAEGINFAEVKPESLHTQLASIGSLQNGLTLNQQTNQLTLTQFMTDDAPVSDTVTIPLSSLTTSRVNSKSPRLEVASPLRNKEVTQIASQSEDTVQREKASSTGVTSVSLQAPTTGEPDTTALTTLAIVCDNIGSGKDRQYVVKVELEEPVASSPAKSGSKSQREKPQTKPHHHHTHHRKKQVSAVPSPLQTSKDKTTSQTEINTKSIETKRPRSKRKSVPEIAAEEQSKLTLSRNSPVSGQTPVKKSRTEKLKTSNEKKSSTDMRVIGDITRRKSKNCNSTNAVSVERIKLENDGSKSAQSSETVLSQLPSDVQPKVETAAALSPASTIPYGDDSNDSVDLSGRSLFKCSQCSKSYTSDRSLRLHIGLLHQESDKSPLSAIFSCTQCTKAYTSQKRLDLHRLLVHETPDRNSPYSRHRSRRKRRSSRRMREVEEQLSVEKESLKMMRGSRDASDSGDDSTLHGCALCKKQYTSKSRLTLHIGLCHDLQNGAIVEKLCNTVKLHSSKHKDKPSQQLPNDAVSSNNVTIKTETASEYDESCYQNKVQIKEEPVDTEYDTADKVNGAYQRTRHSCSQCGLIFMHLGRYQEHLPVHDSEKSLPSHLRNKKNRCVIIERYYMYKSDNEDRPYACKICEKDFAERRCFTNHVSNVHEIYDPGDKIFPCTHCTKQFTKRTFLDRHLASHAPPSAGERCFKCADCNKTFTQKAHVQRHHRLMHLDVSLVRIFTCDLCGRSFKLKSHLQRHLKMHEGSLPFQCSICTFMCADRHALRGHMRCHTGEKPFKCPHCSKCFSMKNNMQAHIVDTHEETLTDAERRKHQCTICKKIMNKGAMKLHMRVHKNDRPYQCDTCGKAFFLRHLLRDHCLNVHEGERKYKCAKCQKCYASKTQLKLHLAKKH